MVVLEIICTELISYIDLVRRDVNSSLLTCICFLPFTLHLKKNSITSTGTEHRSKLRAESVDEKLTLVVPPHNAHFFFCNGLHLHRIPTPLDIHIFWAQVTCQLPANLEHIAHHISILLLRKITMFFTNCNI